MRIYRIVYTYSTINGDKADIYYTRAKNKGLAERNIMQALPYVRIETIRRAIYDNKRDKSDERAITEEVRGQVPDTD